MNLDDLPEISALGIRSKASWGYDAGMMEVFAAELTLEEADFAALSDAAIATINGDIAGYYTLMNPQGDSSSAELEHLFVDPRYHRQGIGKTLLYAAMEAAKTSGATRLRIISDPFAVGFYLKHGAKLVGEHHSLDIPGRKIPIVEIDL